MAFTYVHRGAVDGSGGFDGADKLTGRTRRLGEPWRFGLRPEEIPAFLKARGLTLVEDLGRIEQQIAISGRWAGCGLCLGSRTSLWPRPEQLGRTADGCFVECFHL